MNNIINFHYHYRVDPYIGKVVSTIIRIPYACLSCVAQHNKEWLPNCATSNKPRCAFVETITIKIILKSSQITGIRVQLLS